MMQRCSEQDHQGGPLIPQHGGYRKLRSFQLSQLVYEREKSQYEQNGRDGQHGPSIPSMPSTKPCRAEIAANAALVLIGVACALLDRHVAAQARFFEEEGGFTERLYRVRQQKRPGT
jgi:four helix bundle suffix protein